MRRGGDAGGVPDVRKVSKLVDKQAKRLDYQTPRRVLDAVDRFYGGQIPLDPATAKDNPTNALYFFTKKDNGLTQSWDHDWFVNPPFSTALRDWLPKIAHEATRGPTGLALLPCSRWEQAYYTDTIKKASMVCFFRKRLRFINPQTKKPEKSNPYASALWLFSQDQATQACFRECFQDEGTIFLLMAHEKPTPCPVCKPAPGFIHAPDCGRNPL